MVTLVTITTINIRYLKVSGNFLLHHLFPFCAGGVVLAAFLLVRNTVSMIMFVMVFMIMFCYVCYGTYDYVCLVSVFCCFSFCILRCFCYFCRQVIFFCRLSAHVDFIHIVMYLWYTFILVRLSLEGKAPW